MFFSLTDLAVFHMGAGCTAALVVAGHGLCVAESQMWSLLR